MALRCDADVADGGIGCRRRSLTSQEQGAAPPFSDGLGRRESRVTWLAVGLDLLWTYSTLRYLKWHWHSVPSAGQCLARVWRSAPSASPSGWEFQFQLCCLHLGS